MKAAIVIFISCFITYALFSCTCRTRRYDFAHSNPFLANVLDKATKQNVLLIGQVKYNYDTVRVYNEKWEAVTGRIRNDGLIVLNFIEKERDKGKINQLIERRFYMYFNYQDIDTIDIAFQLRWDDCNEEELKYFRVAYNDSVYFEGTVERTPGVYFLK
jgi:hypothetical protein